MKIEEAKDVFAKAIEIKLEELGRQREGLRLLKDEIEEYIESIYDSQEELLTALEAIDRAADNLSKYM